MTLRLFLLFFLTILFCSQGFSQAVHHRPVNISDCNRNEAIFIGKITDCQTDGETVWIKAQVVESYKYRRDTCEISFAEPERFFPELWNVNIGEEWLIFAEQYRGVYYLNLHFSSSPRSRKSRHSFIEDHLYKKDIAFLQKTFFSPNQRINSSYQTSWQGCVPDDDIYHASGALEHGYPQGLWQYFYSDGRVMQTGRYIAGRKDGEWYSYRENGQLHVESRYENGLEVWRFNHSGYGYFHCINAGCTLWQSGY